jgi:TPP-dependent pyruvate/acetoin dehydrogenase alpha subunit
MKKWEDLLQKFSNPIYRLEKYLIKENVITPDLSQKLRDDAKNSVRISLKEAIGLKKPGIDNLFEDVYENVPPHIEEQR